MSSEHPENLEPIAPRQPLSTREIDLALHELKGWSRQEGGLRLRVRRPSFNAAIAFVNAVAGVAEEANHHPDIDVRYRNVILSHHPRGRWRHRA
jgi:4a-hydroxytetrahydrobiopterin dehydratase